MKTALITGITGQDGAYLARFLLEKGYQVFGAFRRTSELHLDRLQELGVADAIHYVPIELLEITNITRALEMVQPDEVYNLGAQSFVGLSFEEPVFTAEVTGVGVLRVLEAIRAVNPKIRFYQASSSEMFGDSAETPKTEHTPFHPRSPYAAAKLFGHWVTINYRDAYDLHATSGILFNHESPLRGSEFVTRKVSLAVARIKAGVQEELLVGNLDSYRDWGYAPEYVEAMWLMLQQDAPDDYVIATGQTHSVREFITLAFGQIGEEIVWQGEQEHERGVDRKSGRVRVRISPQLFRPTDIYHLVGDCTRAYARFGWSSRTKLEELVRIMVDADVRRLTGKLERVGTLVET